MTTTEALRLLEIGRVQDHTDYTTMYLLMLYRGSFPGHYAAKRDAVALHHHHQNTQL